MKAQQIFKKLVVDDMLSGDDIQNYLNNNNIPTIINKYSNLRHIFKLKYDDLVKFLNKKSIVILNPGYSNKNEINECRGHWSCLFSLNNQIYNFDSFGRIVDNYYGVGLLKQYDDLSLNYRNSNFNKYGNIHYNDVRYQKKYKNSCGFWTCVRLLYKNLNCDEFEKMIKLLIKNNYDIKDLYYSYF